MINFAYIYKKKIHIIYIRYLNIINNKWTYSRKILLKLIVKNRKNVNILNNNELN